MTQSRKGPTAREAWKLADEAIAAVRRDAKWFNMEKYFHPCGSPACLAGHTLALRGESKSEDVLIHGEDEIAGWLLGLPPYVSSPESNPFFVDLWPAGPRDTYASPALTDEERAELACEVLEHFVTKAHGPRPRWPWQGGRRRPPKASA